jgi:tRNA/rRNA methyltransferase
VIDIVPEAESDEAAKARAYKRSWLGERGYRVLEFRAADLERDVAAALETLAVAVTHKAAES